MGGTRGANFQVVDQGDALESLELRDVDAKSRLVLAPRRGGMATRLMVRGVELLYLDEATLHDEIKNLRGGNPVLFPSPGKLEGDAWAWRERHGSLKQHGFARNAAWKVTRAEITGAASATLQLSSDPEIARDFPWNFVAEYTYTLAPDALRIDMSFTNRADGTMPFGAGFHPYFAVPQSSKAAARVETNATRAFDNVTKQTGALTTIDLDRGEVDLHLVDHRGDCVLRTNDRAIRIRGSSEFSRWVVWTLTGKDFVCVEPWTCPGNALNTGESLMLLELNQTHAMWVEYALV
jgi:galactose mutarotase-like enzyme